jgi:hypothetical protein
MTQFRRRLLSAAAAAAQLHISRRWFYQLYRDYLRAVAGRRTHRWQPRCSGGNHRAPWPAAVTALLRKLLQAKPPAAYSFAASEVHRRCGRRLDRATVRRWAQRHQLAVHQRPVPPPASARRWQLQQVGALWQYDASPHRWLPGAAPACVLLELIDDCSRVLPGARLYPRETLLAHFAFLPLVFQEVGLPLCLYVDYHSFFFTHTPEALTQLGAALKFYAVSLRYAPTPQAKGKIERAHQFWQKRLPCLLAAEQVQQLAPANALLDQLRRHHNRQERHRELGMTPQAAWDKAQRAKRSVLRAPPRCPWWPYVWSLRTVVCVGSDGRISVGPDRVAVRQSVGTRVVRCQHPNGDISVLAEPPAHGARPKVLFHWPASP